MFWVIITNLGDSALMLPSAAIIFLWLLDARAPRHAALWLLLCAAAILLVAATKVAFLGWGIGIAALDFTGISGHSTLSVMVLTSAALLVSIGWSRPARIAVGAIGVLLASTVALSRVHLHVHSWSEAIAGVLLGGAVATAFAVSLGFGAALRSRHRAILMVALLLPLSLLFGTKAPSEGLLTAIALKLSGHPCAYSRLSPNTLACAAS